MRDLILMILLLACLPIVGDGNLKAGETQHPADLMGPFELPKPEIFGVELKDLTVHGGTIEPNQFFSELLTDCNVEYQFIDQLVQAADGLFDFRDMKRGRPYTVLCTTDSIPRARYFIYEHDPIHMVFCDLGENPKVELREKEVTIHQREASGIITHSLFHAIESQNLSPALAVELANMYAWSVDFFHLEKGDKFKVVYEDKTAEGEYIGVGDIKMALFHHQGHDYYAIPFSHPSLTNDDFYAETGRSIKKAFLKAPVKFSRISSPYSGRRFHPVQKRYKAHLGTDYAAPRGTPIWATAAGTVSKAGFTRGNGNYVKIKHDDVYSTQYLHMTRRAKGMTKGRRVKQGEVIGYVGSTGLATGPHVCYRFWKNGKQVNHRKLKLPDSPGLPKELLPEFFPVRDSIKRIIDAIEFPEPVEEKKEDEETEEASSESLESAEDHAHSED